MERKIISISIPEKTLKIMDMLKRKFQDNTKGYSQLVRYLVNKENQLLKVRSKQNG